MSDGGKIGASNVKLNLFKSTVYSECNKRLKLDETGKVEKKSDLFRPGFYSFFSKIGQWVFRCSSISENNLEIQLKSIIMRCSGTASDKSDIKSVKSSVMHLSKFKQVLTRYSKTIFGKSDMELFKTAVIDLNKLKNQDGEDVTPKKLIELQVELLMIQYHFAEYLASDKGGNSKLMLDNILNALHSKLEGDTINNKDKKQLKEQFIEVLSEFKSEIDNKVNTCSLSKNDYLKYLALVDSRFDCCGLADILLDITTSIRNPLSQSCNDKKLASYIKLPDSINDSFEDVSRRTVHRLSTTVEQFSMNNIFTESKQHST